MANEDLQTTTLGSGCFWCTEAVFQDIEGIESVVSGYSGGNVENPTYEEVCGGDTGHAEVVQIRFNPEKISYEEILKLFFKSHDPTTLNRQGNDVGTQYRSVIFYHNKEQRRIAENMKKGLDKSGRFEDPIVTEIAPFEKFYKAEDYHQNYFNNNPDAAYCQAVIRPKLEKLQI